VHQAVEEFASAAQFAAVEAEREFVRIILKMFPGDRFLVATMHAPLVAAQR
jgi:hypothetical protein